MSVSFQVDLSPSRRAGWLRRFALVLTGMVAGACLLAAVMAPSRVRISVALAAVVTLAVAARRWARSSASRLRIDADGTVRIERESQIQRATVGYCGRHLVCLRTQSGLVPIWPDALPADGWRRLLVACRWPRAPEQARVPEAAN
jgi:hypothetical protein